MEKWKVAAIASLLLCLGLYGVIQANGGGPSIGPVPTMPTPTPLPIAALQGKEVKDWNFAADQWANTPRPITLQGVKGSVTLLEFWRTGCSHCLATIPDMIALSQKYGPQGLKVVTFQTPNPFDEASDDENNWPAVKEFIRDHKITYPVAFDKGGKLFKAYKGTNYPTIIVLDRNGIVRLIQTGHTPEKQAQLEATLKSELSKK